LVIFSVIISASVVFSQKMIYLEHKKYKGTSFAPIFKISEVEVSVPWAYGFIVTWGSNGSGQCNVIETNDIIALTEGEPHNLATRQTCTMNLSVAEDNNSVNPASQDLSAGTNAVIDITPDAGYVISSIEDNGTPVTHKRLMINISKMQPKSNEQKNCFQLFEAIKNNNFVAVQSLVKSGVNINSVDKNEATALMWSVYRSDLKMVRYLIEHGANPKLKGIIWIDDHKTSYYGNLTTIAAGEGKFKILKFLIEQTRIPVDDKKKALEGCYYCSTTALFSALWSQNKQIIKYLAKKGANLENTSRLYRTPLHEAVKRGYLDIVKLLLKLGANPNGSPKTTMPPVVISARDGKLDVLKALLKFKVNINIQESMMKYTPLMIAVLNEHFEICKILIKKNANLQLQNKFGGTAYVMAKAKGNSKIINLFKN